MAARWEHIQHTVNPPFLLFLIKKVGVKGGIDVKKVG